MPAFFTRHALALAVSITLAACGGGDDPSAPPPQENNAFALTLSADKALILQGSSATVTVNLVRKPGFEGAVQVALTGLPAGVTAGAVNIAAGSSSATITLNVPAGTAHSLPTDALVIGSGNGLQASQLLTVTVRGLPGSVDTSYAGGRVIAPVGGSDDYANGAVLQADGKLIVVGSGIGAPGTMVALARFLRDGSLDTSFGSGGKVLTALGPAGNDLANAVAVQADGKIVVVGRSDQGQAATGTDFAVLRYNADGSLDTTFGNGGKVLTDFNHGTDNARAVLIQPDGKIVVGGEATLSANNGLDFALARYNADGSLDQSFGQNGKVSTALQPGGGAEIIRALAFQTVAGEQRILAVGGEGDFMAARYTAAGVLDSSFASNGKLLGVFNSSIGSAYALTVLPDGRAAIAGHMGHDFALVQLTVSGALDTTFGNGGKVLRPVTTTNWDEATAIVRQADGKLVVGGWAYSGNGSSGDFAVQRYTAAGAPDLNFGTLGTVVTPMANGTLNDLGHTLVLQPDERLPAVRAIQAGEANGSNHDFAVTRYWL